MADIRTVGQKIPRTLFPCPTGIWIQRAVSQVQLWAQAETGRILSQTAPGFLCPEGSRRSGYRELSDWVSSWRRQISEGSCPRLPPGSCVLRAPGGSLRAEVVDLSLLSVQWLAASIQLCVCQALAEPLRRQLYQAPVSMHFLASAIESGFGVRIWDGSPGSCDVPGLLPSLDVVAVSQAPSPELNPDSPYGPPLAAPNLDQQGRHNQRRSSSSSLLRNLDTIF
uniref:LRRG00114 n=1 Tax=Rattus norvegicus TaxID=10116 RepID=Q6QI94_RAT|nr:LRRGT00001 [Rattus norvegicus]AAS66205.1 LRRG00114 [Rattus norvegicus]